MKAATATLPRHARANTRASGSPLLLLAWAVLVLALAATVAWLYFAARHESATPSVTLQLDPVAGRAAPAQTAAPLAKAPASEATLATGLAPIDPALLETTSTGQVPRIGADGRKPWQVYARPFDAPSGTGRLAVVVGGLGLDRGLAERAISQLPPEVTLGFVASAPDLPLLATAARLAGHEVVIELPMQPADYPASDPGPATLLQEPDANANRQRIGWILSRAQGYVGVVVDGSSPVAASVPALLPVFDELRRRGIMMVDDRAAPSSIAARLARDAGVPRAFATMRLDNDRSTADAIRRINQSASEAKRDGQAMVLLSATPALVDAVRQATAGVGHDAYAGIAVAPITALADRQPDP